MKSTRLKSVGRFLVEWPVSLCRAWLLLAALGLLVVLTSACGDEVAPSTEPAVPTVAPVVAPEASGASVAARVGERLEEEKAAAVSVKERVAAAAATEAPAERPKGLELVAAATVRIVSQITLADPQFGTLQNVVGQGSGFLISADGLVVTANHVVTGVGTLNVYVPGRREPVNARVVAASECADVALIQLPGGGYPFLEFHESPAAVGTGIYAAGYPLGEPEYALVSGIVSKWDAPGETSWASVEQVIQHDAAVNPGNSGGPLVTEDGRVLGVVYAGNLTFNQFFAIGIEVALPVLEVLRTGENVDWIGVNGEAFAEGGVNGVWVWSVESGSPADVAGVAPGGVIVELERLELGRDGTMRDYCDVLRTHGSGRVIGIKVVNPRTGELLEGQLNGRTLR